MKETTEWELGRRTKYFNGTLRKLRLERGLYQKDIANAVGVATTLISHYETLRQVPTKEIAKKIADFLGVKVEQVFPEFLSVLKKEMPIEDEAYAEVTAQAIEEYTHNVLRLQAENEDPEKMYVDVERKQKVAGMLDVLTDRERKVIEMHFGLGGRRVCSYDEIGAEFSISGNRVRQIAEKALTKLRKSNKAKDLAEAEGLIRTRRAFMEVLRDGQ